MPSGVKFIMEGNGFDAFVTFFHPISKYAGPGTDGIMGREVISTVDYTAVAESKKANRSKQ